MENTSLDSFFGRCRKTLFVVTAAIWMCFAAHAWGIDAPTITLSPDSLIFAAGGQLDLTVTVETEADVVWSVTTNVDWLSFEPETGVGSATITATAEPNRNAESGRTGFIIVVSGNVSATMKASQDAYVDPEVILSTTSLTFGANDALAKPVTVASKSPWTVSPDVDWIILNKNAGTGDGDFSVQVMSNTGARRMGSVTLTALGHKFTVQVTQEAYSPIELSTYMLSFGASDRLSYPVDVIVDAPWAATSGVDWLTITPNSGSESGTFTAIASPNTGGARSTIITVLSAGKTADIEASQDAQMQEVSVAKASKGVAVRVEGLRLHIDSPAAETVYVYSLAGELLHAAAKEAGATTLDLAGMQQKIWIVKGSSGWTTKVFAAHE